MIAAIFGLIKTTAGRIVIDGIDLNDVSPKILRQRIAGLPQHSVPMSGTVRTVIDPTSQHSNSEILDLLGKIGLDHVELDVEINDYKLSVGQQQLFAFGRAVLRKATIIVMDEATSG